MTPDQLLQQLERQAPAAAYLLYGPEIYQRGPVRRALIERVLPPEEREAGYAVYELGETSLGTVMDDALSFSLFATHRLIWVANAELALPRVMRAADDNAGPGKDDSLAGFLDNPPPGTTIVFDAARYGFDGEDKAKLDRVLKFYGAIKSQVEFRPYSPEAARTLAGNLARKAGLQIGSAEIGILVESLGADAARIEAEIEKLSLFAGRRKVTTEDLLALVPNAQASNVFAMVSALGRGDRRKSLDILDTLVRDGEYLPLALTFLATQFRLALVAREAGLKTSQQILGHFGKAGVRIWPDRANQVQQTVSAFSKEKLEKALKLIFEADRGMRDTNPEDRIVMERLILSLTE